MAPIARVVLHSASGVSQMLGNLHFGGRAGTLAVDADRVDFGAVAVGGAATQAIGVSNEGNTDLLVGAIDAPAAPFVASGGTCGAAPFTLAPGQSCTLAYSFAPTADGAFSGRVVVGSNDPSSPGEVMLRGRAGDDVIFANGFEP
jgi:hypothetical protein